MIRPVKLVIFFSLMFVSPGIVISSRLLTWRLHHSPVTKIQGPLYRLSYCRRLLLLPGLTYHRPILLLPPDALMSRAWSMRPIDQQWGHKDTLQLTRAAVTVGMISGCALSYASSCTSLSNLLLSMEDIANLQFVLFLILGFEINLLMSLFLKPRSTNNCIPAKHCVSSWETVAGPMYQFCL